MLDPISRLSEIMFGLLMALTFTGTMSVTLGGGETVRSILLAAIGCNIAWGIVDGVMWILTAVTERAKAAATGAKLRAADGPAARLILREALPEEVAQALSDAELDHIASFTRHRLPPAMPTGVTWPDVKAAGLIFLLVVAATFPPILPFLLTDDAFIGMRWSNAVAVAMLFAIGLALDRQIGPGHWQLRVAVPVVGSLMVAVTIALGG